MFQYKTRQFPRRLAVLTLLVLLAAPAAAQIVGGAWTAEGPGPNTDGQVENIAPNDEVVGAIHTVVAHPTNTDILWVGAVNGGIWRTNNATAQSPTWTRQSDAQRSLSITALDLDPNDGSNQTLVAGFGRVSSFGRRGGSLDGLLRTTNGGNTWTPIDGPTIVNKNVSGIAARGSTIVVSARLALGEDVATGDSGVFRSTDGGASFVQISTGNGSSTGLPLGASWDLVGDPQTPSRLFVTLSLAEAAGGQSGVYRSDDTGATWTKVSSTAMDNLLDNSNISNAEIAVGLANNVFVAIATNGSLSGVFRSGNGGSSWTSMDVPSAHPGGQASIHLSIVADPVDTDVVYIGGDRQNIGDFGAQDFSGRLFRGDAGLGTGRQFVHLTHSRFQGPSGGGTLSESAPHADSREMTFDAIGNIIETDDGGIYRRTDPRSNLGDWFSVIGNLQTTEYHDAALDANSDIVIGGAQDTGTPEQITSGGLTWRSVSTADGGDVAVDDDSTPGFSVRYSSNQFLGGFRRRTIDANNNVVNTEFPNLTVIGGGSIGAQFSTPVVLNNLNSTRLIIGGGDVFESFDQGDTLNRLSPSVTVNGTGFAPIAYGAAGNIDILYVGSDDDVWIRTTAGGALVQSTSFPGNGTGSQVSDIVVDPSDPASAFAVDSARVYHTSNTGQSWIDATGNLASFDPGVLHTNEFIPDPGNPALVVGADRGVFIARESTGFATWSRLGTGLANAPVFDLDYDPVPDKLVAGTLGRGAWSLSPTLGAPDVTITQPASGAVVHEGDAVTFAGTAVDVDDGDLSANLAWTSSIDGTIGTGASFSIATLSGGTHTITASVTDSGGSQGADSIFLTVIPAGCSVNETFEGGAGGFTNSPASTCTTGSFVVGTPTQMTDGGVTTQLQGDHTTGVGNAFFSAFNTAPGSNDVDGGTCIVESPTFAVSEASDVSIWYFHGQRDNADDAGDFFLLEISTDGGSTFSALASIGDVSTDAVWTEATASVPAGSNVQFRLQVADGTAGGDLIEAGLDDLLICGTGGGGNTAPSVTITAPADGSSVDEGQSITFTGTATDTEDGDLSANLSWSSSLDGAIGSGASFSTSTLSVGTHTITASVTDSGGLQGSDAITGTVNAVGGGCALEEDFEGGAGGWTNAPSSTCTTGSFVIGTPTEIVNGGVTTQLDGDHTTGTGNAFFSAVNTAAGTDDVDGGNCIVESPVVAVQEASDVSIWYYHGQRDAGDDAGDFFALEISTDGGATFSPLASIGDVVSNAVWTEATASVPAGSNVQFRLQVSDGTAGGDLVEAGLDDVSICPSGGGGNTAPSVTITAPADGSSVTVGDAVTFTGTATDAEDGDLTANLAWTSSLNGTIGSGSSFTTTALSVGTHTITASVTDSGGLGGSDAITVTVDAVAGCTVEEDFEGGAGGWTNSGASTCTTGSFVVGTPTEIVNGGVTTQLAGDHTTGTGNAFFSAVNTGAGTDDVDGGNCIVTSPVFAVGPSSTLSIWYYHGQRDAGDDATGDFFDLEVSTDGGVTFSSIAAIGDVVSNAAWTEATFPVPAGASVQVRVQVSDGTAAGDLVEAGVDDFSICSN